MRRILGLIVALALGACGRPSGPVEVDPALVPFEVARSATPSPGAPVRTITAYLVRDGALVPVAREVASAAPEAEAAVASLLQGPTAEEVDAGLSTAIPSVVRLLSVQVVGEVAHVDLSEEFQGPASPEEVQLRVAQVVWTLVARPEIGAVAFSIDGDPISVPTQLEPSVARPVGASDFPGFLMAGTPSPVVAEP